jgi:hypothetical protein
VRRDLEHFACHRPLRRPSQPKQHWDFHQPERRLTTRRASDKAPIRKKGCLNFPYSKRGLAQRLLRGEKILAEVSHELDIQPSVVRQRKRRFEAGVSPSTDSELERLLGKDLQIIGPRRRSIGGTRAVADSGFVWRTRMRTQTLCLVPLLAFAVGCATPPVVKQALVSLDQGYAENTKLMNQYGELVGTVNERFDQWYRYVQYRARLDLALRWATTDPLGDPQDPKVTDELYAQVSSQILGDDVVKVVNEMRLKSLRARKTPSGQVVFGDGKVDITTLVQRLPGLVNAITASIDKAPPLKALDRSAFGAYEKNVGALRKINATIKGYLDIDVTVAPQDVKEIADAIREIQR